MKVLLLHNRYRQPGGEDAVVQSEAELLESQMAIVIATIQIAWPLYTVIGSTTAVLAGLISNKVKAYR